jgi:hypothetical protein
LAIAAALNVESAIAADAPAADLATVQVTANRALQCHRR